MTTYSSFGSNRDEEEERRRQSGSATTTSVVDPRPAGERLFNPTKPQASSAPPSQAGATSSFGGGPSIGGGTTITTTAPNDPNAPNPWGGAGPTGHTDQQQPEQPNQPQQQMPDWYDRLWQTTTSQPNWAQINPALSGNVTGARDAAAAARGAAGAPIGGYGSVGAESSDPLQRLQQQLMSQAAMNPDRLGYAGVDANMPKTTRDLMSGAAGLAQQGLDQPSRYDTDLFNTLLDSGLSRLDQSQSKDRLDLLRDSARRLGPQSGQLSNEYIDLANEYDRNRHDFTANLAREAAMTQAQDRNAALAGARGVAGDIYGQERGLRDETRGERGFERETDMLNFARRGEATDRLARVAGQQFGQEAALRGEQRQERAFDFGVDTTNRDLAARQAGMEQSAAESNYGMERGVRDEQRGERDFGVQDRLRQLNELQSFGQVDRQLGRDAMDDYFRHLGAEQGLNESQARLQQQEFMNAMALAQLYASLPAGVGGTPEGEGRSNYETRQGPDGETQYYVNGQWVTPQGTASPR